MRVAGPGRSCDRCHARVRTGGLREFFLGSTLKDAHCALAGVADCLRRRNGRRAGSIAGDGVDLLYPLFNLWVPAYAKAHPDVQFTTQGTGSGTGIAEALSGVAQIGASDAYMSNPMIKEHPDVLNIPLAISSQMVNYNIPGLNNVQLKLNARGDL